MEECMTFLAETTAVQVRHLCLPLQFSDGAFTGVTAIKSLNLENNKLKSLPKSLDFGTVTNLKISNNPWSCTCQLAPLRR